MALVAVPRAAAAEVGAGAAEVVLAGDREDVVAGGQDLGRQRRQDRDRDARRRRARALEVTRAIGPLTALGGTLARTRLPFSAVTFARTSSRLPTVPRKTAVVTWPSERPEIRTVLPPCRRLREAQLLTQATLAIFGVSTNVTPPVEVDGRAGAGGRRDGGQDGQERRSGHRLHDPCGTCR